MKKIFLFVFCFILTFSFYSYSFAEKSNNKRSYTGIINHKTKESKESDVKKINDSQEEKVNLNTATIQDLHKIKYFGKKKAEAVIEYRMKNGDFKKIEDLLNVKVRGLNKKWLDKISDKLKL